MTRPSGLSAGLVPTVSGRPPPGTQFKKSGFHKEGWWKTSKPDISKKIRNQISCSRRRRRVSIYKSVRKLVRPIFGKTSRGIFDSPSWNWVCPNERAASLVSPTTSASSSHGDRCHGECSRQTRDLPSPPPSHHFRRGSAQLPACGWVYFRSVVVSDSILAPSGPAFVIGWPA